MNKLQAVLFDIYREDLVLCDKEMNRFTFEKYNQNTIENPSEYDLCSDRF